MHCQGRRTVPLVRRQGRPENPEGPVACKSNPSKDRRHQGESLLSAVKIAWKRMTLNRRKEQQKTGSNSYYFLITFKIFFDVSYKHSVTTENFLDDRWALTRAISSGLQMALFSCCH